MVIALARWREPRTASVIRSIVYVYTGVVECPHRTALTGAVRLSSTQAKYSSACTGS